jgi:hypothetical protein
VGTRDDGFDLHQRCTQRFDDATRDGHYFDCAQCSEKVLDLSSLTFREYARWRARPRDSAKPTCVRAKVDADGRIVLADEPAPTRKRLPVLPAMIAATMSAACERSSTAPSSPVVAAEPRAPVAAVPSVASIAADVSSVTAAEAIGPPTPSVDPSLIALTDTHDAGPARSDAAVADGRAIVRLRHPHPPGRHRGRVAATQTVEEFAGMDFK